MNTLPAFAATAPALRGLASPASGWMPPEVQAPPGASSAAFAEIEHGLRRSGGLVAADVLAEMMRASADQPISRLARWIVEQQLLCISWRAQTLVPLFQLGDDLAALRPGLLATLAELRPVFEPWELALWFASPNSALEGHAPADRLRSHPVDVWHAARADRFIATGG